MNSYPIKIGRTRASFFTKIQKNKIEAGIQIFLEALKHKHFAENVLSFQWVNNENKRFHRFYHANGLSNRQVFDRIQKYPGYFEDLGSPSQLVILPFSSRKDIQSYKSVNNPIIWISLNCIHHDWYTPIHIASVICHELAVLLDLDNSLYQFSNKEYKRFTVPAYLGKLVMQTAFLWKDSVTDIDIAFQEIDASQYNYFPASTTIGSVYTRSNPHTQGNFETLISSLLSEQEKLIVLQDKLTTSEAARLICIEEVLLKLHTLKTKLADSSLDGSEYDFQLSQFQSAGSRSQTA